MGDCAAEGATSGVEEVAGADAADGAAEVAFSGAAGEAPAAGAFGATGAGAFRFKRPDTSGNDGFPAGDGDFPAAGDTEEDAWPPFPASAAAFSAEADPTAGAGRTASGALEGVVGALEAAFSAPVPALFSASDEAGALMPLSR